MSAFKKILLSLIFACALGSASAQQATMQYSQRSTVIQYTRDMTAATASVGYTGIGFRPRSCLFLGAIDGASTIVVGGIASNTFAGNISTVPTGLVTTTGHIMRAFTDSGFINSQVATLSSFDADGFTLNWTKSNSPTGTLTIQAFCFR